MTLSKLPLEKLTNLWSIRFTWKWFYDTVQGIGAKLPQENRDLVVHYHCLRELQMPYTSPSDIPFDRLPMLTHLDLLSIQVLDNLGPVIRQVPQLESLSVFCCSREHGNLFGALSVLKHELPNLHSLCLLTRRKGFLRGYQVPIIVDFLQGRTRLRRFRSSFTFRTADQQTRFLGAIASLQNLETLNWDALNVNITKEYMQSFLRHVPPRMSALSLATAGAKDDDAFTDLVSATLSCDDPRY